jgi:hypothetical protein
MFQVYVSNVSVVFRIMLQVFHLDIAYAATAIHACVQGHVSSVSSIFKCILQVFYLNVAYVANGYVLNVSSV